MLGFSAQTTPNRPCLFARNGKGHFSASRLTDEESVRSLQFGIRQSQGRTVALPYVHVPVKL